MNDITTYLEAKRAYYAPKLPNGQINPIMSDAQFDALEAKIRAENPNEPALKLVGTPPENSDRKRKHLIPMGSQEKVNSLEELVRWERLRANDPKARFHASWKGDGGSVALYYAQGHLVSAVSRGDGSEGEDILFHTDFFKGIPQRLNTPLTLGIRCEAVMTLEDWKKEDPELASNPRNLATGILGRLDTKKSHRVTLLAFDFETLPGSTNPEQWQPLTETERFMLLAELGFQTPKWAGNLSLEGLAGFFEKTQTARNNDELPYWIDGLVVRYENLHTQEELGMTDGRPKGQVAWKFPAEEAGSTLLDVEWQVGQSGAVTPVGHINPVRIGGTTVSKASLANATNIKTLGAYINAPITVVKRGDIIPMIIGVRSPADEVENATPIEIPTCCPVCQAAVATRKNTDGSESVVLFCTGDDCDAQITGKIKRFAGSRNILGLGKSIIQSLADQGIVTRASDLFDLEPQAIKDLIINEGKSVRLGLKRAEAICQEIKVKCHEMQLAEFLGAFGTRSLGVRRAALMMQSNPELLNFERWFDDSLLGETFATQAGVPKMGRIIQEGLREQETVIRKTLAQIVIVEPVKTTLPVGGKTICITGSLPSGKKKKDYAQPLADAGHKLVDDLTKEVEVLVMADPSGPESSKTKKAKKMGIELWDESQLVALISSGNASTESDT